MWHIAEAEQNKAVALKLAAAGQLAESQHSNQLQLHALLAIESTKRYPSPLANQSLRHALDLMPRPLATMVHQDSVSAVSFSPDGKTLASGSGDTTVRVWIWQPQDLILAACERSTRNLNWDEWQLYFEDVFYTKTCEHLPVHESVIAHAQQLAADAT